jgi:DNA-binding NarL/FixJ family response regulator
VIRVLVVDDARLFREQVCRILRGYTAFKVVAEASSAPEAIEKAKKLRPDVILLDIRMAYLNGLQAIPLIKSVAPQSEILIVSQYDVVREAFAAGARGFLDKCDAGAELLEAVTEVFLKNKFVSKSLQTMIPDSPAAASINGGASGPVV